MTVSLPRYVLTLERALRAAVEGNMAQAESFVAGIALGVRSPLDLTENWIRESFTGGCRFRFKPTKSFRLLQVDVEMVESKDVHFRVGVSVNLTEIIAGHPGHKKLELEFDQFFSVQQATFAIPGHQKVPAIQPVFIDVYVDLKTESRVEVLVSCTWQ